MASRPRVSSLLLLRRIPTTITTTTTASFSTKTFPLPLPLSSVTRSARPTRRILPPKKTSSLPGYFSAYQMAPISTPSATSFEWLVIVPDKPGMQDKRLEVRAQHLENVKPLAESGVIKTGGAILNEKPESDDASQFSFYGSTLVCVASSREEILDIMKKDIYATSGVWDLENVQIWPAKYAFRNP